jgi:hypothetical protein
MSGQWDGISPPDADGFEEIVHVSPFIEGWEIRCRTRMAVEK